MAIATIASLPTTASASTPLTASRPKPAQRLVLRYDFHQGDNGWQAGFADYTRGQESLFELQAGIAPLPANLGPGRGFYLQGHNRSDDLIMFVTRRLTRADGIQPGQKYRVHYALQLASDAPSGGIGSGGATGESVFLKVGGAPTQPRAVPSPGNRSFLRLNVDFGEQSEGGAAASVIGNLANGIPASDGPNSRPFASFYRQGEHAGTIQANAKGELYLLVGTDSGFEGMTRLYYQRIQVTLTPEK